MDKFVTVEQENFKKAMSNFSTGITVITFFDKYSRLQGMTVNSFNSVSLDPLLVLYSLGKNNKNFDLYLNSEKFVVNILSNKQKRVSDFFSSREREIEGFSNYCVDEVHNVPILNNVLGYLICKPWNKIEAGDHYVMISEVLKTVHSSQEEPKPLIYFNRDYYNLGDVIDD
jgi:flavin reductase (DIM6/NTAB) family NADH-FMN oxidoreductase RutF